MYDTPLARVGRVIRSSKPLKFPQRFALGQCVVHSDETADRLISALGSLGSVERSPSALPGLELTSPTGRRYGGAMMDELVRSSSSAVLDTQTVIARMPRLVLLDADCRIDVCTNLVLCGEDRAAKAWTRSVLMSVDGAPAKNLDFSQVAHCIEAVHKSADIASGVAAQLHEELLRAHTDSEPQNRNERIDIRALSSSSARVGKLFDSLQRTPFQEMDELMQAGSDEGVLEALVELPPTGTEIGNQRESCYLHSTETYSALYRIFAGGTQVGISGLAFSEQSDDAPPGVESTRILAARVAAAA